ncbi:MAG: HAMP domain-containing histidine kinase [Chitinophagaceae bacterium]|nr:HAMP domain-containing histidine kinase [Chitinophagaceae bacterium]
MGSSATRIFILTFGIVITIVVGLQMYWLYRTYSFEQQNFHTSVVKSIRGLYEDIDMAYDPGNRLSKLVETPNHDTYIFRTDSIPVADSLTHYLTYEFDDFNVYTDCIAGIYDSKLKAYAYMGYLPSVGSPKNKSNSTQLPLFEKDYSYVCLYFPHQQSYVLSRMNNWIIVTIIVLVLLIGLSFTLYYFFRQKFLNEVQTDFINNVTHEFSTPLAVIELSTDGIERHATKEDGKLLRYAVMIRDQATYLKKHIVSLMNTVTAEHHSASFEKSPVVANSLVRRAVTELATLTNEKNGNIILQLEDKDIKVNAEPEQLYLAIFNIMNNALKYASDPRVVVTTYTRSNDYYIRIRDNGQGIDKKEFNNIFRKFYRVQNGNVHQSKGLGLGLYLTRKAVLRHGGTLKLDSTPGEGATFTVVIPIA